MLDRPLFKVQTTLYKNNTLQEQHSTRTTLYKNNTLQEQHSEVTMCQSLVSQSDIHLSLRAWMDGNR
jgi:hypothetical protein